MQGLALASAHELSFANRRHVSVAQLEAAIKDLVNAYHRCDLPKVWGTGSSAAGLKAYAGAAPVTRASGKKLLVLHRKVKNQRLAAVGYLWTFAALRLSTGARAHYDRRRVAGDRHTAAQRHLFNRFLGCLYYCLQTGQTYAEAQAFPVPQPIAA